MAKRGTMPSLQGLSRRQMLRFAGVAAVASLGGRTGGVTASVGDTGGAPPFCVARPRQTEGPYYVDARLERSDLRSDPTDGTRKSGVPVALAFHVFRFAEDACTPLAGAVVDLWQCDALGVYSGVQDVAGRFDTREQRFLRGYQVTDSRGMARFTTLYPGWYSGRAVHIHFKIRTAPEADLGLDFTSQLYFDDALTDRVHQQAPYAERGSRNVRNDGDGIYRRSGGDELVLDLTESGEGYRGAFRIALEMR
ncbi:twin-arginine translocation pathway signal protein [Halomonas nitroreducens]|uniref:Twin-arginine translocation pathway signal protein n=2 Tax=Halomonas nitroreducens TaxID=447425 RepID=A0A3S0HSF1_9GAMM|nr:twin-arginine translocation pathway signal protein [Halomonas nitroreducens]